MENLLKLIFMQTPVRVPFRGLVGRITGYEWVNSVFRCYAVECPPTLARPYRTVWMVRPEEVETCSGPERSR